VADPWEPRYPLTAAEQFVDFPAHRDHIVNQRYRVERAAAPTAKRLALHVTEFGLPTNTLVAKMEQVLIDALMRSVRFGYREAQREIRAQRSLTSSGRGSLAAASAVRRGEIGNDSLHSRPGTILAYTIPDAGRHGRLAKTGLPGIYGLVRQRSRQVAHGIVESAHKASYAAAASGHTRVGAAILVAQAVRRTLHNSVLELVGESLNLGRTAGALESYPVPEFALRSEQLDERTCEECDSLHGEIAQIDTADYYDLLPPEGCLGGGRCRGIMVYEG
jgi:hypothetical protein